MTVEWKFYRMEKYVNGAMWHEISDKDALSIMYKYHNNATPMIRRMINEKTIVFECCIMKMEEFVA